MVGYWYPLGQIVPFKQDVYRRALKACRTFTLFSALRTNVNVRCFVVLFRVAGRRPSVGAGLSLSDWCYADGVYGIHLKDKELQHYVFMARGLNAEAVGKVTLGVDEGLVAMSVKS